MTKSAEKELQHLLGLQAKRKLSKSESERLKALEQTKSSELGHHYAQLSSWASKFRTLA